MPPTLSLVLLPGMDGTGRLFAPLVGALEGQFALTIVQYPNDRKHTFPALVDIVRSLLPASQPYFLVAESFSAPIAILCAAHADPNLRGLILCAGFAHSPVPSWLALFTPLLRPVLSLPLPQLVSKWLLLGNTPGEVLLSDVHSAVASVASSVLEQRLRESISCDVRRELALATVPLLYIRAKEDRLIGVQAFKDIRAVRPDASLAEIQGPHLVFQREPQESARAIRAFIQDLA